MFPMKVEITINGVKQLQEITALLAGDAAQLPPKKAAAKSEAPEETVATAKTEDTQSTTTETAGATYTLDDAKALTMKVVAAKGRDAAVELLTKFGVKVAAKLEESQVAAFCTEAEAVLS